MSFNKPGPGRPAKGAGRTVVWGRDEEYVSVSNLDGARQAEESGICGRCDALYRKNDWVFTADGVTVAVNCCATGGDRRSPGDPVPLGLGDLTAGEVEDASGRDWVPLTQVMPLNRSKRDMCPDCFQIPAANGACSC